MVDLEPFVPPNWAGKPPPGLHLDVTKGDKLIQKLMTDEKNYYLFGRNAKICDFITDHNSCSRVHAALVWHQHLHRAFLIDLGSVHGTFIGSIRLEIKKPQQIPINSPIHFGASTRLYILREKPQNSLINNDQHLSEYHSYHDLPEDETELENLTEFNTAHNRRITSSTSNVGDINEKTVKKNIQKYDSGSTLAALNPLIDLNNKLSKPHKHSIRFSDREEIINPEDIDPSIGRYRNMVQTIIVPKASSNARNPLALQKSKTLHPKALLAGNNSETAPFHSHQQQQQLHNSGSGSAYYDRLLQNDENISTPSIGDFGNTPTPPFAPRNKASNSFGNSGPVRKFSTLGTLSATNYPSLILIPNPAPDVSNTDGGDDDDSLNLNVISDISTHKRKRSDEVATVLLDSSTESASSFMESNMNNNFELSANPGATTNEEEYNSMGHKKKKYAKEAWPGKGPNTYANLPPTLFI